MRDTPFALAIDVGNSRVTAAVAHATRGAYDAPVLFSLSASEHSAPSVALIDDTGSLVFGAEAERLGRSDPRRLTREFAQDVGTETPVVVGVHAVPAEDLIARLCSWIVDEVTAAEGEPPELIAVTHPASWGGHRLERLRAALQRAGIDDPALISESEAAAAQLAASHPVESGQLLAVYDLGGTRFDARVLRKRSGSRYQPIGEQVRIEHLGGANFDDALLHHVLDGTASGQAATSAAGTATTDAMSSAITRLRGEVVTAKEMLSSAGDATVHLSLPTGEASVRVTRSEFEAMIADDLDRTAEALDLAIESAGAGSDQFEAIVLAGGSSRIPLVAQRLSQRFDLPIIADAEPQMTTVLGAARIARERLLDDEPAPGSALATITVTEKAPAPRPEPKPERAGVFAFLRPILGRRSRSTSPLLLAGAAVFIAITIVFSSTTAAGTRWPDYVQETASRLLNLPMSSEPAPSATPPDALRVGDRKGTPTPRTDDSSAHQNTRGSGPQVESSAPPEDSAPPATHKPGTSVADPGGGDAASSTPTENDSPANTPPNSTTPDQSPADPPTTTRRSAHGPARQPEPRQSGPRRPGPRRPSTDRPAGRPRPRRPACRPATPRHRTARSRADSRPDTGAGLTLAADDSPHRRSQPHRT